MKADVYDGTRKILLQGREDMLGLAAAQLKFKVRSETCKTKPVWVDIGGGTGYNIEAMQSYLDVPTFFSQVYLVDLSPSLLHVARKRFQRLGWDVKVICQDALSFRLQDHNKDSQTFPVYMEVEIDGTNRGPRQPCCRSSDHVVQLEYDTGLL